MDNITAAKEAWSHLALKDIVAGQPENAGVGGRSLQKLYDALADDVVLKFAFPEDTYLYGGEIVGKEAIINLWTNVEPGLIEDADLVSEPEFYTSEDCPDRVVMIFRETYRIAKNDVTVPDSHAAMVMDFRDGKIVKILLIEDSVWWNDAYGWSATKSAVTS
ncbi:MAG: hypothetical protein V7607_5711 [Solirubrobacteraceae bacterium]